MTSNSDRPLVLDCTLRDGGYYTNWDFPEELVNYYFEAINQLPVDYVEIGYISKPQVVYRGAFYYLPFSVLSDCRKKCDHRLAIMLNQKEISLGEYSDLLKHARGMVDLIRLAVKPENIDNAILAGREIKDLGFEVGLNLMYASEWGNNFPSQLQLNKIKEIFRYFYIVDSFGGLFPEDVKSYIERIKSDSKLTIGFHGHNNLELAMANALSAIDAGIKIIDSTILGMGRGAGNLKTELLLSILYKIKGVNFDFDILNSLTGKFDQLRIDYKWGTNLPFMVSGIRSLPQDSVMSKVKKRYFSLNGFTQQSNFKISKTQSLKLKVQSDKAVIVGGGDTVKVHSSALIEFLRDNPEIPVLFASSKNVSALSGLPNQQWHLLAGNEGKRLEKELEDNEFENRVGIAVPEFFNTLNYIPQKIRHNTVTLEDKNYLEKFKRSVTAVILQLCKQKNIKEILLCGYDGYGPTMNKAELELFEENERIFKEFGEELRLISLTPTEYGVNSQSVYTLI